MAEDKRDDRLLFKFIVWVLEQPRPADYVCAIREAAVNKRYLRDCMAFIRDQKKARAI